jgi:hypothetical protein
MYLKPNNWMKLFYYKLITDKKRFNGFALQRMTGIRLKI